MTRRPELRLGPALLPGVLAAVLFAAMALIVVNTSFGTMSGFDAGVSITSNIGYALFDLTALLEVPSEPFLASFLLAAIVLDAALDASLVLAKREEAGEPVTALSSTESDAAAGESGEGTRPTAADGGRAGRDDDAASTGAGGDSE